MRCVVFSSREYDRRFLSAANEAAGAPLRLEFHETHLSVASAVLADQAEVVCPFVNDRIDRETLATLHRSGTRLVALRCAGFNNVDLDAARDLGISVARVPAYSPHAVAEHTICLLLTLVRGTHRAFARVREGNFALEGLLGFDLAGKTAAVIGTGEIGRIVGRILDGFGCVVLGCDPRPDPAFPGRYVDFAEASASADIITLHCPLTPQTRHLVNAATLAKMKQGVTIINTSRGAVIDARAAIDALKSRRIGLLGLDVYEEEDELFFTDLSDQPIQDDIFARLLTFPNVLITGHQGFFTAEALEAIATTTVANCVEFARTGRPVHEVGH